MKFTLMKKYFSTGLAILLPIILTVAIVHFLIVVLTNPFLDTAKHFIEQLKFFHHSLLINFSSRTLILFVMGTFVLFIGLIGKYLFIDIFLRISDALLRKLPVVNKIYKASKDVVQSLFSDSSMKFSQVVFAPFPNEGALTVALVTNQKVNIDDSNDASQQMISVFIPTSPNPTIGYMLMFKKEQLIFVNMKVEEAMKFIVSCGIVLPQEDTVKEEEKI